MRSSQLAAEKGASPQATNTGAGRCVGRFGRGFVPPACSGGRRGGNSCGNAVLANGNAKGTSPQQSKTGGTHCRAMGRKIGRAFATDKRRVVGSVGNRRAGFDAGCRKRRGGCADTERRACRADMVGSARAGRTRAGGWGGRPARARRWRSAFRQRNEFAVIVGRQLKPAMLPIADAPGLFRRLDPLF